MTRKVLAREIVTFALFILIANFASIFLMFQNNLPSKIENVSEPVEMPRPSAIQATLKYSRQAAYGYAQKWYNARNNHYQDYSGSGGDCANFVSQCLIAGGISLHKGTDGTGYGVYPDDDRPTGQSNGTIPYCDYLNSNLQNYQNTSVTYVTTATVPAEVTVGDAVIFGSASGDHYSHAMIVIWDGGAEIGLAAHTSDVWNRSFSSAFSSFSCATFYHFLEITAEYHRFKVNATSLNVRVGPGKNGMTTPQYYSAIGTISKNQQYIAFEYALWEGRVWWHFWFDDRSAWCAHQGESYDFTEEVTGNTTDSMQPVEVQVTNNLNARNGPGTGYAIFGQVYDGMRFVSDFRDVGTNYYRYWISGVSKYSNGSYLIELDEGADPTPPPPVNKTVMGFLPYWVSSNQNFTPLTHLAWFSIELNSDGSLGNKHGWPATSVVSAVHAAGRKIVLTATLFSSSAIHTLISTPSYRATAIANLLTEVQNGLADGICIDFENPTSSAYKGNLVDFMRELNASFIAWRADAHISICTPSKDWWNTYDFDQLANYSYLMCMGYGYYYSGSSNAGPTSPLEGGSLNLKKSVEEHLTYGCPRSKMILGLPFYGYDYPVTSTTKQSATRGDGSSVTYTNNIARITQYGATVYYDEVFETPWYNYYKSGDGWHQVWCDSFTSLRVKFNYVLEENLAGIGIWAWGYQGAYQDLEELVYAKFFEDTRSPWVNITAPANNSQIVQSSVTVTWTGSDNCELLGYELRVDNNPWQDMGLNNTVQVTDLSNGVHNITVRANDTSYNSNSSWINITIGPTGDSTPPFVEITTPTNSSTIDQSSVMVNWTGSDNVAVAAYAVSVDEGPWIYNGLNTSYLVSDLSDGSHNVTVRANDTSDYTNTSIVLFTVDSNLDTTPPTIQITSPVNDSTIDVWNVTIQWTGFDDVAVKAYAVSHNGSAWQNVGLATSYFLQLSNQGLHNVTVRVNDTSDNTANHIIYFTVDVSVDITPPNIQITSPADMSTLHSPSVTIQWSGMDNYGIYNYLVSIDGGSWYNNDTATSLLQSFVDGLHTVSVCANDTSNNNATHTISFWVDTSDTTPPFVQFLSPANNTEINVSLLFFEWNATDNEGVAAFSVSINGGEWQNLNLVTGGLFYFADGHHEVRIRATDIHGNTAINTTLVTVDTTKPHLSYVVPTVEVGKVVILTWSATDATTSIASVQVLVDGIEIYSGAGTFCQLGPFSVEGAHSIEIRVTDILGNTEVVVQTFNVGPVQEEFPLMLIVIILAAVFSIIIVLAYVLKRRGNSREQYYPKLLKK